MNTAAGEIGYAIGTLFGCGLMAWGAWRLWRHRSAWARVASVFLGLWLCASAAGAAMRAGRGGAADAAEFNRGFTRGCVNECVRKGAIECHERCACVARGVQGSRSAEEFSSWLSEHVSSGSPDNVLMSNIKANAQHCFAGPWP